MLQGKRFVIFGLSRLSLRVGSLPLLACRYTAAVPVPAPRIEAWRSQGGRVLAVRPSGSSPRPPMLTESLGAGDEAILCGPDAAIRAIMAPPST